MLIDVLPDTPPLSVAVWIVQMLAYHGFGLWFEWLDRTGGLQQFKVRPPERKSYFDTLPRVIANQLLLLLPAMMIVQALGLAFTAAPLTPLAVLAGFAGLTVGHDVVQYVTHRFLLHRPSFLRRLGHDVHHCTTASRAISACYMSYADYTLEIILPYLIPLILIGGGGDLLFHAIVVTAGAFGGLYEHSGYDFSLALRRSAYKGAAGRARSLLGSLLSSEAHGAHHMRGNVSFSDGFGSSNICDTVFRTRWDLAPLPRSKRRREAVREVAE